MIQIRNYAKTIQNALRIEPRHNRSTKKSIQHDPTDILDQRDGDLLLNTDDDVNALGVEVARLRTIIIAAAMLITASVVAISGVISWSGSWSRIWNA